ncbi:MAG: response regulator [Lewinellaceae bacterium]|nr:response regulator [Lewinellaceae bacterium]
MPSLYWKLCFVAGGLILSCCRPAVAQDSIYTHWPTVIPTGYDSAKSLQLWFLVDELLAKPTAIPVEEQPSAIDAGDPGWDQYERAREFFNRQQYKEASEAVDKALDFARENGEPILEMRALEMVGMISREVFLGSSLKAVPYHEQALSIAQQLRDTLFMVRQLLALADNYGQAGQYERFLDYGIQAARLLGRFDVPAQRARLGNMFGAFLSDQGDFKKSEQIIGKTIAFARKIGDTGLVKHLFWQLFWSRIEMRDADLAAAAIDSIRVVDPGLNYNELHEPLYQLEKLRGHRDAAFYYLERAYRNLGNSYERRSAEQLAGWETRLRTREKELQIETEKRVRNILLWLTILISALLLVSIAAWYLQRRAKEQITLQKQLIEDQAETLRHLDELKSRFFANVSHELRTPLTLMLGPLETLSQNGQLNPQGKQMLAMVMRNGRQLHERVNELLLLGSPEMTDQELHEQPTNLFDFMSAITDNFGPGAAQQNTSLRMEFEPERSLALWIDRTKMLKILNNLLSNALKFTPAGGEVVLQVCPYGQGYLHIRVRDSGRGIPPEDLPHIFELYFQSRDPDVKAEGGAGIGLALSSELARLMGGALQAESEPGKGSLFTLDLPLKECVTEDPIPLSANLEQSAGRRALPDTLQATLPAGEGAELLIVEDNTDLQSFLRTVLSPFYRVSVAGDGKEAIKLLKKAEKQPDLIITDLMMPVMDGYQLLEKLQDHSVWRTIPVILLTARAGSDDRLQAFRIGIDDYILKPFGVEELLVRVENALRNQSVRREWGDTFATDNGSAVLSADENWLEEVTRLTRHHLDSSQFNVDLLADLLGMKRTAFYQRIRQTSGLSANQFIQEMRLQKAREMLEAGKLRSVKDAAEAAGFRSTDYFSRLFRQRYGKSPAEYV